ncbi:hypothetical protein [Novosphingobium sp.]|uniref:hypothetical protein n=1 Tax=Novosphingobium sp. TaxID=1874826 RepID=UPI0038B8C9A6
MKRRTLQPGATVRMTEGAFEGLRGTVESVRGTFAQVRFADWKLSVAIALHLLEEDPRASGNLTKTKMNGVGR